MTRYKGSIHVIDERGDQLERRDFWPTYLNTYDEKVSEEVRTPAGLHLS